MREPRGGQTSLHEAVVAVCTFRRVGMLRPLIEIIAGQIARLPTEYKVRVAVIDNDPDGSAREEIGKLIARLGDFALSYHHEAEPGVGFARNLAFTLVRGQEWLIFFDDDQVPDPDWLSSLLHAAAAGAGDLYVGPVRPVMPMFCPKWAEGGWAWARPEFHDGEFRGHAGFGNIMLSPKSLADPLCRVGEDYLHGPGEDTSVTLALAAKGYRIVHVLAASASEPVSPERISVPWVLERHRKAGRIWAQTQLSSKEKTLRLSLSLIRLLASGAVLGLKGFASGNSRDRVRARTKIATAGGYLEASVAGLGEYLKVWKPLAFWGH